MGGKANCSHNRSCCRAGGPSAFTQGPSFNLRLAPLHILLILLMLPFPHQIPMGCSGIGNATGQPWSAAGCLGDNLMQVAYQADWYAANVLQASREGGGDKPGVGREY